MTTYKLESENLNELAVALSKAQSEMTSAIKESSNPFFKSKYADLHSVWEAGRGALSKNGLSVSQLSGYSAMGENSVFGLYTTLLHSSGQFMRSFFPIQPVKADPQSLGSATTYARRYALAAILGIVTEDDDGNAASNKSAPVATSSQAASKQADAGQTSASPKKEGSLPEATSSKTERLSKLKDAFKGINIDMFSLEHYFGKPVATFTDFDFKKASELYSDIKLGKVTAEQVFAGTVK